MGKKFRPVETRGGSFRPANGRYAVRNQADWEEVMEPGSVLREWNDLKGYGGRALTLCAREGSDFWDFDARMRIIRPDKRETVSNPDVNIR